MPTRLSLLSALFVLLLLAGCQRPDDIVRYTVDEIAAGRANGDDLVAARKQAQLQLVRDAETPWERARQIAVNTRCGTRMWSIESEVAAIGEVNMADVAAAATVVADGWTAVVRPSPS